jgi:hypothetical protein
MLFKMEISTCLLFHPAIVVRRLIGGDDPARFQHRAVNFSCPFVVLVSHYYRDCTHAKFLRYACMEFFERTERKVLSRENLFQIGLSND